MKQLTIGDLAPYLPYKLRIVDEEGESEFLSGLDIGSNIAWTRRHCSYIGFIKPYLRPLSQLTQEIEHNGERVVTVDLLNQLSYPETIAFRYRNGHLLFNGDGSEWNFLGVPMEALQLLFSLHFDVFGLIDAGLALPIEN